MARNRSDETKSSQWFQHARRYKCGLKHLETCQPFTASNYAFGRTHTTVLNQLLRLRSAMLYVLHNNKHGKTELSEIETTQRDNSNNSNAGRLEVSLTESGQAAHGIEEMRRKRFNSMPM